MSKAIVSVVYEVDDMFGDCGPAGIVFSPNLSKWMDASSPNFLLNAACPFGASCIKRRASSVLRC